MIKALDSFAIASENLQTRRVVQIYLLPIENFSFLSHLFYWPEILVLYSHLQHHNDTIIKQTQGQRRKKTSFQIYSPLTLLQGFERVVQGLHVRECWRPNMNFIFWPNCYDRHIVSFLFSWCSTGGLGLTLSGVSESPLGRVWPSLPHVVSSCLWVCWQLLWDPNSTELNNNSTPKRSPTGSLNRMFNRHQAEITVMQFIGQSLPAHHFFYGTVRIFTLSHIVSQAVFYTGTNTSHQKEILRTWNCFACVINLHRYDQTETSWCLNRLIKVKQRARKWKFQLKNGLDVRESFRNKEDDVCQTLVQQFKRNLYKCHDRLLNEHEARFDSTSNLQTVFAGLLSQAIPEDSEVEL